MTILVTDEDVYNNLNIDLAVFLGVKGQTNNTSVISNWIAERHEEILDLIAAYAYGGRPKAERIMLCPNYALDLKKAVLYQCAYVIKNGADTDTYGGIVMGAGTYIKIELKDRLEAIIAPKAYSLLLSRGLLYTGRC